MLAVVVQKIGQPRVSQLFVETIDQLWTELKALSAAGVKTEPGKLIALIKIIGSTAKTIREVLGHEQLRLLFQRLL
jgi:hypothetical protein